jgi:hypothetical protein
MNSPNNNAPPIKTGGFKGKRQKAKFSRNFNKGKERKHSVTRERYQAAQDAGLIQAAEEEDRPVAHSFAETGQAGATAAIVTKKQLKAALRKTARDVKCTAIVLEKERKKKQRAETIAAARSEAIKVAQQDAIGKPSQKPRKLKPLCKGQRKP